VCPGGDRLTYVSRPKKAIRNRTNRLYMEPIPYAHLQLTYRLSSGEHIHLGKGKADLARATRKPKAKGERKGEMMKPIVQMLS
jgi:hypothetical protein